MYLAMQGDPTNRQERRRQRKQKHHGKPTTWIERFCKWLKKLSGASS